MTFSKAIFCLLCFLFVGSLYGQDSNIPGFTVNNDETLNRRDFRYAAKLGGTFTLRNWDPTWVMSSGVLTSIPERASVRFDGFRPCFQVRRPKGNIHEFSFQPKLWRTVTLRNQGLTTSIMHFGHYKLGYGYFMDLMKSKAKSPFAFFLGFQANPYFTFLRSEPVASTDFRISDYVFGMQGQIVPRIAWYSSKRIFADLSVELSMFEAFAARTKTDSPLSSVIERTNTRTMFQVLPMYHSICVSIGAKI